MTKTSRRHGRGPVGDPSHIEGLVSSTEHLIQSGECPRCHERLSANAVRCPTCKVRMQEIRAMARRGRRPLPVRRKTPEEMQSSSKGTQLLLVCASAASASAVVLVVLAIQRVQPFIGSPPDPNAQFLQGLLIFARNVGLVACFFFGLSVVVLYRGKGRALAALSQLGAFAACGPPLSLVWFSLGYIDCYSSCTVPGPGDLLWPAFLLQLAATGLGFASAVSAASLSSVVPDTEGKDLAISSPLWSGARDHRRCCTAGYSHTMTP